MKTIETMAEAIFTGGMGNVDYKNIPEAYKILYEKWAVHTLQSIHEPDPHVVAIVADKLKMDATKVAAVWMLMVEKCLEN